MQTSQDIDVTTWQDSPWWALYTRHQHEKTVAGMLSAKGFEVFLPLYDSVRRWNDRKMLLSLPLFPCYVFVRGGLNRRLQVVTTPGVHMILSRGEHFATIPDDEIQAIRKSVSGDFRVEPHPFLKCGERVRVTRGSLFVLYCQWICWRSPWPWRLTPLTLNLCKIEVCRLEIRQHGSGALEGCKKPDRTHAAKNIVFKTGLYQGIGGLKAVSPHA